MSRMFKTITKTWNVFTGCKFDCTYCWVDELLKGRLGTSSKYKEIGKAPTFHPSELNKKFKPSDFIFVAAMGDLTFCPSPQLEEILIIIKNNPEVDFLIQTKGVKLFQRIGIIWPRNVYHGITIETNRDTSAFSKAPAPFRRFEEIVSDRHPRKFISVEPIMDFDMWFIGWIINIMPEIVEIGADNYHHNLPEPSWDKVVSLMSVLRDAGIKVVEKEGLERLQNSIR